MKICRQAAMEYCAEKNILLDEAMAMLDMDFTSEGCTCVSDDKSSDEEDEDVDGGIGGKITKRQV